MLGTKIKKFDKNPENTNKDGDDTNSHMSTISCDNNHMTNVVQYGLTFFQLDKRCSVLPWILQL